MHRPVSHRLFAIVLLLTQLVLGDLVHAPVAQAEVGAASQSMHMMMGDKPCSGMVGTPADDAKQAVPGKEAGCCKSSQCLCLHVPVLAVMLYVPAVSGLTRTIAPGNEVRHIGGTPDVFFRPPI